MRLAELTDIVDTDTKSPAPLSTEEIEAIGQRLVPAADNADLTDLTDCNCGLLLVALRKPVTTTRTYVIAGRAIARNVRLTHAHAAHPDTRRICCSGCYEDPDACTHNPDDEMCDTPEAVPCADCGDPVAPGENTCHPHTLTEPEWDKDVYTGP